jgi:hypothetical protein
LIPIFVLEATDYRPSQIYSFSSGINKEAFLLFADLGNRSALVAKRPGKEGDPYVRRVISSEEDVEQIAGVLRKIDLSDILMANTTLMDAVGKLRVGAERYFVNLGLFSNYFLTERLVPHLNSRGRKVDKETSTFFEKFEGAIPTEYEGAKKILGALDYNTSSAGKNSDEFELFSHSSKDLNVVCILTKSGSLDTKGQASESVPSYLAVSALNRARWVILTNGRLWRLYSNRVSSPSTNYFEIDLENITGETDPKLQYFVSLFSCQSLIPRADGTDLDSILEGGLKYARDVEDQLRVKIFEGQLFLNLIRAILSHSNQKKYSEAELANSKATALRLLYRLLFVLYAESRSLLPVNDSNYKKISLDNIRRKTRPYLLLQTTSLSVALVIFHQYL